MQISGLIDGVHYCFIVDEIGMASVFPQIKLRLAEQLNHHVSLAYSSANQSFTFKKELDLLEKIFCLQFMVLYEKPSPEIFISQETIEAIINANVMEKLIFIVSGREEFIEQIRSQLYFLGIKNIDIQEQLFT